MKKWTTIVSKNVIVAPESQKTELYLDFSAL